MTAPLRAAIVALALASLPTGAYAGSPPMRRLPAPEAALEDTAKEARDGVRTAMFGGGCFWGVQAVFAHVKGVRSSVSGYSGEAADYRAVSSGITDSVEAVVVTYDPKVVTYGQLLQVFFSVVIDPTEAGGQTPDQGSQYQATLFYADVGQKRAARSYIDRLTAARVFDHPIVVEMRADHGFHEAEPYHQDYVRLHSQASYVKAYDAPRLAGLKTVFPELYDDHG